MSPTQSEEKTEEVEEEEVEYEDVSEEEEDDEQNPNPNPIQKPSLPESITHLQSLHGALSEFLLHFNSLKRTLDSINSAIDAHSNNKTLEIESELESICRTNAAKSLRKYISTHLLEADRLRGEVPEALKLAPDPAKLVLDAMGKFYLQGIKAFDRGGDSNLINNRHAGILLLEFYVIAGCPVAEKPSVLVKENARDAAISWRSRLIGEGGVEAASALDALGLVLLVGSFGIPPQFRAKDLYSLLRLSNLRKKGDVLCHSPILVQKMPDIIKDLIAKGMHVEAVDLVCAFGLEQTFPPLPLLSSFVEKTCEVGVEEKRGSQGSLSSLKEATEKQLAALKSVVKCLEDHELYSTKLASLKIDKKITKYEKDISRLERKLQDSNVKRKFKDVEALKNQDNQTKQLRPSSAEASHGSHPPSVRQIQEHEITAISGSRYVYNDYIANHMPVSSEASHVLVDRNDLALLARNVHEPAVYQSSVGQSLLETRYPSGYDYTRYSADAGQTFYQPSASGQTFYRPPSSGQKIYQPSASGQSFYQQPASSLVNGVRSIYQFPGTVSGEELPHYSTKSNAVLIPHPSHQSSYMG